ncbi:Oxidoreductase molybdopterin binding domain-containing protein [Halogranum gelatinilyticum]|uniref:Oxidoreductase molybdopterin binding domain-containing protein n=1 Tax=Halogranum gelatinilyticum TaxID=660521 RepID=A0A1G9YKZ6_9EURY|nr:molybdopterin-dependent oxidoreductase [Halogranum gelatinilyticum]SDN09949.1 Oxidoreductase molybdopterin binding domain-containing protein [Halogranum gelatinilyticum]
MSSEQPRSTQTEADGTDEFGGADAGVEVGGDSPLSLSLDDLRARATVDRECTISCASGERTTATWTGVPVAELLSDAGVPETTTHLRVTSDDGYRACLGVTATLDAVVAVARDGEPLAATETYPTRFVGPYVDGERAVKGVVGLEPLTVAPQDDPTELETLSLDDSTYG